MNSIMDNIWPHNKPYVILGYNKEDYVYVRLAVVYTDLDVAIKMAEHMATMKLRDINKPFDYIEVVTEHIGLSHHVVQCI